MKKVSIIVPVYNVYEYLEECLNSICIQTLGIKNIEVIIVNDGSTDNSMEIINKFLKKYPNWIIIDRENKGLSVSRNDGIARASGEYLMFLDSDDYLAHNTLEEMYHLAKKENSDVLIGRMQSFDSKGFYGYYTDKIVKTKKTFSLKENKKILKVTSVCCKLYRRSFIKRMRFIPNIKHEDNYFSMCVYTKAKRITTFPRYFYFRRFREGENLSIMQTLTIDHLYDLVKNYEIYFSENKMNKNILRFSIRTFDNYIISRLKTDSKKLARKRVLEYLKFLLHNKTLNKWEYYIYNLYHNLYYFMANIYYCLRSIIKNNKR